MSGMKLFYVLNLRYLTGNHTRVSFIVSLRTAVVVDVPAGAGFLCDKAVVLIDMIKGTVCSIS
jgi:hypothetical protein